MRPIHLLALASLATLIACGGDASDNEVADPASDAGVSDVEVPDADEPDAEAPDVSQDVAMDTEVPDAPEDADAPDVPPELPEGAIRVTVMTFNIGTTLGLAHDRGEDTGMGDGYTREMAEIADELYENSLSWNPAEAALTDFLGQRRPTIVAFQEMFFDPWCEEIEVDPALDFVCRDYTPERPLQIQRLLGPDYQVACAQGQDDNCVGILKEFGQIRDCPADAPCLGGLEGMGPPDGCSNGARVGRLVVDLPDGRALTVVNVHGTSGTNARDMACRVSQFGQIFVDRGDGQPAASGEHNLVLGDLNTDPFRFAGADPSADFWNQRVGEGLPFHYVSSSDPDGPATYAGLFRIDHIASDTLIPLGCVVPGSTEGVPPVIEAIYWDHRPVVCEAGF